MKSFLNFKKFFEWCGLQCGECGSFHSTSTVNKKLEWASNFGDVLKSGPFYAKTRVRTCTECNNVMSSRLVGTEAV